MHFLAHEVQRTGAIVDSKTGKTVTYNMDVPRLVPGAMLSQMPNCPENYSASPAPMRKSRSEKLQERNNKELAEALRKSQEEYKQRQKENEIQSLQDIKQNLKYNNKWKLLDCNKTLSICTLGYFKESGPNIISALTVDESLMLNAYVKSQRLNLIGKHRFPLKVNFLSDINSIFDEVELLNNEQLSSKTENALIILRLNLILSLLKPLKLDSFKFCNAVKFTYHQLSLMTK